MRQRLVVFVAAVVGFVAAVPGVAGAAEACSILKPWC